MPKTNRFKGVSYPSILALLLSVPPFATTPAQTPSNEGPGYSVTDQGAFYRVWQSAGPVTNAANGQVLQGVQSYTEVGDGLNFLDVASGQWLPAQDVIAVTPTGAAAVQGQIKASFSGDITASGAIALTTASGLVFSRIRWGSITPIRLPVWWRRSVRSSHAPGCSMPPMSLCSATCSRA